MGKSTPLSQQVDFETLDERTTPHRWGMTLTYELPLAEAISIDPQQAVGWRPVNSEPVGAFGPVCLTCHAVRVPGGYVSPCEEKVPEGVQIERDVSGHMSRAERRRRARKRAGSSSAKEGVAAKAKEPLPEGLQRLLTEHSSLHKVSDGLER